MEMSWVQIRNILLAFSGVAVGLGLGTDAQVREFIEAIGTIVGAAGAVLYVATTAWQWIVRFRTRAVPDHVAGDPTIPTVSPATGKVEPPTAFVIVPPVVAAKDDIR